MHDGVRDTREIGYELAKNLVDGAHRAATELGISVAIAVVDTGGHLVAAGRMDGAPFGVMPLAIDKAYTAAGLQAPTDAWQQSTQPGGPDWGMHTSLGGRLTVYPGGLPIRDRGVLAGGLGVSGGEGEQDRRCAEEALRAAGLAE